MFKLSEIKELIKLVDQTTIQELEIENEGARLAIRKPSKTESVFVAPAVQQVHTQHAAPIHIAPPAASAAAPAAETQHVSEDAGLHKIVSPMVGTFYRAPSPTAAPFVNVGDKIDEKSVVCIVEAMKLMNDISAEVKGEIVEILVDNGQLVEYGQALFLVKTH